ncbi:MAG TPA: histidine phosphatase family protein [Solirubrobacterales bacterium]|jgi:probable phosphoglycerate mutase|nr:histidine phosphatase family protein [Solirubrobacterales bacterium]
MRVHFIRHGESASNAAPGAMALPDAERDRLTELGWEQAREAGRHLERIGATRILTSPLRRARETAEAIAETLDLEIVELHELHELRESDGYGGLSPEERRLRRWSVWMSEHADDPDHSYRRGESFNDVLGRVRSVQARLVAEPDDNVLAVSHGIFLRFFLMWSVLGEAFGPGLAQRLWQLRSHNCGLCTFEHEGPDPGGYATDAWRCLTWMERPWDPP